MGQCELNYMLMCRLFPNMESTDEYDYDINERFSVKLQIVERCKYTTCVRFSILSHSDSVQWLVKTEIEVRLYHDAHLAEVVDKKGVAMLPVNPYPNPEMLQKDEKQSLNNFLGEWLSFCLKNGRSTETILTCKVAGKEE